MKKDLLGYISIIVGIAILCLFVIKTKQSLIIQPDNKSHQTVNFTVLTKDAVPVHIKGWVKSENDEICIFLRKTTQNEFIKYKSAEIRNFIKTDFNTLVQTKILSKLNYCLVFKVEKHCDTGERLDIIVEGNNFKNSLKEQS